MKDALKDIAEPKTQLGNNLTTLSMLIGEALQWRGMDVKDLAAITSFSKRYLHRLLGGGVNVTMKTISELEVALGVPLIQNWVPTTPKRRRRLGDWCSDRTFVVVTQDVHFTQSVGFKSGDVCWIEDSDFNDPNSRISLVRYEDGLKLSVPPEHFQKISVKQAQAFISA